VSGFVPRGLGHPAQGPSPHLYFHPVDGRLVFFAALLIAVMVLIGWRLIAEKCRKCDGE